MSSGESGDGKGALSAQREKEIQEAFMLFDIDGRGRVPSDTLGSLLRSLGFVPTEEQIAEIQKQAGDYADFPQFLQIVAKYGGESVNEDDIVSAFKVFDKNGTGYVSADELRSVMTTMGEKLSEEDMDAFLAECDVNSAGMINYRLLSKKLAL